MLVRGSAVAAGWQEGGLDRVGKMRFYGGMDRADLRTFTAADADWLVDRHQTLYAEEEGFDDRFGVLVRQIVTAFLHGHDPAREQGWVAVQGTERLGSIFCVTDDRAVPEGAKLRLFFVERSARGTGLAQRLLDTCMDFARGAGYTRMRLWTHESHRAAVRLYARNGFRMTSAAPVRNFGRDLVEQMWERAL
jgi:GNAT superfamily N-acetyltransferase